MNLQRRFGARQLRPCWIALAPLLVSCSLGRAAQPRIVRRREAIMFGCQDEIANALGFGYTCPCACQDAFCPRCTLVFIVRGSRIVDRIMKPQWPIEMRGLRCRRRLQTVDAITVGIRRRRRADSQRSRQRYLVLSWPRPRSTSRDWDPFLCFGGPEYNSP
jgi:hypothetical protein